MRWRVVTRYNFQNFFLISAVKVSVNVNLTVQTDESQQKLRRIFEGKKMEIFKISLSLIQNLSLCFDEIVAMQLVHPIDDFLNDLPVILDLLVLYPHSIHLNFSFFIFIFHLSVHYYELKTLLHLRRTLLDLVTCLLDTNICQFLINWISLVVKQVFLRLVSHTTQQSLWDFYSVVFNSEKMVKQCLIGMTG